MSAEDAKIIPRRLAQDVSVFAADFEEKSKASTADKQARMLEAPAAVLAMEALVQKACDDLSSANLQFLSRESLAQRRDIGRGVAAVAGVCYCV